MNFQGNRIDLDPCNKFFNTLAEKHWGITCQMIGYYTLVYPTGVIILLWSVNVREESTHTSSVKYSFTP